MRYVTCAKCGRSEAFGDDEPLGLTRPDGTAVELRCSNVRCRSLRVLVTTTPQLTRDDAQFLREIERGDLS